MNNVEPNFFIIGAAKSGTTSMYRQLVGHPQIYMPFKVKETFFFTDLLSQKASTIGWDYLGAPPISYEQYLDLFSGSEHAVARGEACVAYLYFHDDAIRKMRKFLSENPKIIIILRNPVERAYSNYLHHLRDGKERLSFENAILAENVRAKEGWWWGFQYTSVGLYYRQVKAFIEAFGAENVKIVIYEDYLVHAQHVLEHVLNFIGVESSVLLDTSLRENVSGIPKNRLIYTIVGKYGTVGSKFARIVPRKFHDYVERKLIVKPMLSAHTRRRLVEFYREDICHLQDLIQRDLSLWYSH